MRKDEIEKRDTDGQAWTKPIWNEFIRKIRKTMVCYLGLENVYHQIHKYLDSDPRLPILITGERGSGKELIAKAIHEYGNRSDGPLVPIDCGAIPKDLMESELFGHKRGAFTGAITDRTGRFEEANGGILFLDEIGNLSLGAQASLLRIIETQEVVRVGGPSRGAKKVKVKIIAATNKNLLSESHAGRFLHDIYDRLRGLRIHVEPLRERYHDIPVLMRFFVERYNKRNRKAVSGIELELFLFCICHDWPGNVRDLERFTGLCHANCGERRIITLRDAESFFSDHEWPEGTDHTIALSMGPPPIAIIRAVISRLLKHDEQELRRLPYLCNAPKKYPLDHSVEIRLTSIPDGTQAYGIEERWGHENLADELIQAWKEVWECETPTELRSKLGEFKSWEVLNMDGRVTEITDQYLNYSIFVESLKRLYRKNEQSIISEVVRLSPRDEQKLFDLQYKEAKREFDREYLRRILERNKWNVPQTATEMNITPQGLHKKMKTLNLQIRKNQPPSTSG